MKISNPSSNKSDKKKALRNAYHKNANKTEKIDEEELEEEKVKQYGIEELRERRLIPLGKNIYDGSPAFMKYEPLTDSTYNVFTFVSPMGGGKSTNVRSMIYFSRKFDPDHITIIFDPMKMEYNKLAIKATRPEDYARKKQHLLSETVQDPETGQAVVIEVEPDSVEVFHLIPRFAIRREVWNEDTQRYEIGYDKTTLEIMRKDGGFVFAEDMSYLTEDQLFNALNFRELRTNQAYHFYLRRAMQVCNDRWGSRNWYVGDMLEVLREGVRKYIPREEVDDYDDTERDRKTGLSSKELQLIETIEKYNDSGFFVRNEDERKRYRINFRKFIRLGKIINLSYLGFKKTEKVGEDLVVGQTDLLLERIITIGNEYYDAQRKQEAGLPIDDWEEYLIDNWKVSMWFEESEIFAPRDCARTDIKKWPCIRRLDWFMSLGRKYGFKNFGFITQRVSKVNPMVFEESNNIFLGPLTGDQRDKILKDFGLDKLKFPIPTANGYQDAKIREIVSTLKKEKHQWVYISKQEARVAPISTFDSPCGL